MTKYNYNEYIGKRYGSLVIKDIFLKDSKAVALCKCDCDNHKELNFYSIINGNTVRCGDCLTHNLINSHHGDLTVLDYFMDENENIICKCKCSCGNIIERRLQSIRRSEDNNRNINCGHCDSFNLKGKQFGSLEILDTYYKPNKSNKNKLWLKCRCSCGNEFDIRSESFKKKKEYNCGKCNERKIIGKTFGFLKITSTFYDKDSNGKNQLWCNCDCICGNNINVRYRSLSRKDMPQISCGCIKTSKKQLLIENWLSDNNLYFTKEENFNKNKDLKTGTFSYYKYDIYIPSKRMIIEFDGVQHFQPIQKWGGEKGFERTIKSDDYKNKWAKDNGYKLIRFNYKQTDDEIINQLELLFEVTKVEKIS